MSGACACAYERVCFIVIHPPHIGWSELALLLELRSELTRWRPILDPAVEQKAHSSQLRNGMIFSRVTPGERSSFSSASLYIDCAISCDVFELLWYSIKLYGKESNCRGS